MMTGQAELAPRTTDRSLTVFESDFVVNAPLAKVWRFHEDPASLPKIMKGPLRISVDHVDRPVQAGSKVMMTLRAGPVKLGWNVMVRERVAPSHFRDEQIAGEGPWKRWIHTHRFEAVGIGATRVIDRIEYEPPFGLLGRIGNALFGPLAMRMMFASRKSATKAILES